MFSSLETVINWTSATFKLPTSTYPQAESVLPFAVVNRTGGTCDYPHDYPRYTIQFWMDSDEEGEAIAFECARVLYTIRDKSERINAVGAPELTQLGYIDGGGFVWQVSFDLATNIYSNN